MNSLKKLALPIAVVAITVGTTNAFGQFLDLIPTLAGDTSNQGRAITPDGQYVVGLSGSRGFLYSVGSASAINVLSSDGAQSTIATGVGYRTSGGTELIVAGMSSGYVTEWETSTGGVSFAGRRRDTTFLYNIMPAANSLGSSTASDAYYVTSANNVAGAPVYLNRLSGAWVAAITYSSKGITSPNVSMMNGVSASGRAVGWRATPPARANYMLTWNGTGTPAAAFFNGLNGTTAGEAFSVSADGLTVFGQSPKTGFPTTELYGYKVVNPGASQTINALPLFGDESGTSRQVPYGASADGKFAVGMDFRSGAEKAALWDTTDPNPANWLVIDLTAFATSKGILDGWSSLTRAYSVGDTGSGLMITGIGDWSPDGGVTPYVTRGFVMLVPEPSAVWLLLAGLGMLVGRRVWARNRA